MPVRNYASEQELTSIANGDMEPEIDKMMSTSMHGIFGMPYQFMESVDRRLPGTNIGRKYSDKIISRLPLLFLTPCKQSFMEGAGNSDKSTVIQTLIDSDKVSDLQGLLEGYSMYYTTELDYEAYYRYVNTMCWVVARYLGIDEEKVVIGDNMKDGSKLRSTDWSKAANESFKSYFSAKENVIFYLDGLNSVSESFSNSTTESSLASTINGLSDQAKELKFILGDGGSLAENLVNGIGDVGSSLMGGLSGSITGLAGNILGSLASTGVDTVLSGGKIIFPELWGDSSFDRSYSLDIKLRSPDNDPLSIYLNILVPYIHLLAFVLPRGLDGTTDSATIDPNGYTSPFLVRAYCKGLFNIDMGLVTGLDVTKGAECCWNDDGLPTQVDISLTIKDLYSALFMTAIGNNVISYKSIKAIVTNTFMMDFLANMAGLNVGTMGIGRKTEMFTYLNTGYYKTLPSRVWTGVEQKISNIMDGLYNKV